MDYLYMNSRNTNFCINLKSGIEMVIFEPLWYYTGLSRLKGINSIMYMLFRDYLKKISKNDDVSRIIILNATDAYNIVELCTLLKNSASKSIDLGFKGITAEEFKHLAEVLKTHTTLLLWLMHLSTIIVLLS